ncbi:MAG: DJ-1/PfpI family protein [Trueperaceae bacterium]
MNIAVLLFHEVHELDAVTIYSILHTAKHFLPDPDTFNLYTIAKGRNSVQTVGGFTITPNYAFASAPQPNILIVPGGIGIEKACKDNMICAYLEDIRPSLNMLVSISGGAFLLGKLGFLRDQMATTHPDNIEALEEFEVAGTSLERVVKNPSGIWCAGGSMAAAEVGLELIQDLLGHDMMRTVKKRLDIRSVYDEQPKA